MGRIYIDVEESPNCEYFPMQTFETRAPERQIPELWVPGVSGKEGPHIVTGWSSDDDGSPCPLTVVEVTDSGAAVSLLVAGGRRAGTRREACHCSAVAHARADHRGWPQVPCTDSRRQPPTGTRPILVSRVATHPDARRLLPLPSVGTLNSTWFHSTQVILVSLPPRNSDRFRSVFLVT